MAKDQLKRNERLRLESLNQAIAFNASTGGKKPLEDVIDNAKKIKTYLEEDDAY